MKSVIDTEFFDFQNAIWLNKANSNILSQMKNILHQTQLILMTNNKKCGAHAKI